ncbi:porin [Alphaproteobacteria bacterium]|nr:porin [Alphaproteobacteria bacterium]
MRKVLLATTALVALGGVSAAIADDHITMSASTEFLYRAHSDNTTLNSAGASTVNETNYGTGNVVTISYTTTFDNGMSAAGRIKADGQNSGFDDTGFSLTGDFGVIGFNGSASEHGGVSTDVTADESHSISATFDGGTASSLIQMPGDEQIPKSTVSWTAPAIGDFSLSLGLTEGGATDNGSQYGIGYTMAAGSMTIAVNYASHSVSSTDATSMGGSITAGDTVVKLATNTYKIGTTVDRTANSVGVTYKLSDTLSVAGYTGSTEDGVDSGYKIKDTGLGATYTITPGMTASITHNSFSAVSTGVTKEEGDTTSVAINVTF